jgi:hypothetical protein
MLIQLSCLQEVLQSNQSRRLPDTLAHFLQELGSWTYALSDYDGTFQRKGFQVVY